MKDDLRTLFIDKERMEDFEYDIAKALFLEIYNQEFSFDDSYYIENEFNRQIIVLDQNKQRKIIYLFNQPSGSEKIDKEDIVIYYKINRKSQYNTRILNKEFIIRYEEILNQYVTNSEVIFTLRFYDLFFAKYEQIPKISNDDAFKYYNNSAVNDSIRCIDKGNISFSNPSRFNDPFDCDLEIDGHKLKDRFRVLCTTDRYNNILMWSYYGEDHKGFCYSYKKSEILSQLNKYYSGICFYGYVKYDENRPKYKHVKRELEELSGVKHILDCIFTKYERWAHEEEFRFIIVYNDKDYYTIKTEIHNIYEGCMGNPLRIGAKRLIKDKEKYDLF